MTLPNLFSQARAREPVNVRGDRNVALILVLLLGLVFAPIIGLHVALAAIDPGMDRVGSAITSHNGGSPAHQRHR
jgi:hypothetical protein